MESGIGGSLSNLDFPAEYAIWVLRLFICMAFDLKYAVLTSQTFSGKNISCSGIVNIQMALQILVSRFIFWQQLQCGC